MLSTLISDLQSIVCEFAYDANLEETLESLNHCIFINRLNIHPLCITPFVEDHTESNTTLYSREYRHSGFRNWMTPRRETPLCEFFVWFSKQHLFDYPRIWQLLCDCDWRTIRPLMKDSGCRSRSALMEEAHATVYGILRISRLFDEVRICHLKVRPTTLGRLLLS